ncbi:phosphate-starvation-inducible PsiE family protein [Myxococcaceae bacterium GXIMD 01537]
MEPTDTGEKLPAADKVAGVIRTFEHSIVLVLMALLMVVVALTTFDLAWLLVRDIKSTKELLLDVEEMLELFGFFLLVLVGMELLSTLKSYLYERVIHVEVVLEVALIALAQKVIILDTSRASGTTMLGLAALIIALAAAFWGVRAARRGTGSSSLSH